MKLIFHGELRKLYGDSFVMQASSVREALEGFSRQQLNWPKRMRVVIPGYDTVDSLDMYADEIDLLPSMYGGGGKFGSILVGIVEIGIAFIPGIGPALSTALIVSGATMILSGVVNLFMKAPTVKSSADPDASKYLSLNANTTAIGTPITMAWGRIKLGGQWLSLNSQSTNLAYGSFPATPS